MPCYKEHDKSFIWHYYTYNMSKAILDLDPDLSQNLLFFVSLSIPHIQTCMMPLMKAELKGFISSFTPKSCEQFMGMLWPQNWKKQTFLLLTPCLRSLFWVVSSHRIKCNASIKSSPCRLHFSQLHQWAVSNIWRRYVPKGKKFDELAVFSAVWFIFWLLSDFVFETTN